MGATLNNSNDQDSNNLHLVLGLSLTTTNPNEITTKTNFPNSSIGKENPYHFLNNNNEPSLTLGLSGDNYKDLSRQTSSPNSIVVSSAFSKGTRILQVKRERDEEVDEDVEFEERISSRIVSDEDIEDVTKNNARKKLRLTKEQSLLLEESFKLHSSTLNPKQKQTLAKQLNLRPRQVEVWFQNRRARTKLKQTEVDCEFLKKCCEKLTEENRRLKKEVQELKALKLTMPMPAAAATLSMCPSCDRLGRIVAEAGGGSSNKITAFTMPPNTHLFLNHFNNSSAAC